MTSDDPILSLDSENRRILEDCIERFEFAWHESNDPDFEQFLPDSPPMRDIVRRELDHLAREFQSHPPALHNTPLEWNCLSLPFECDLGNSWRKIDGGLGEVFVFYQRSLKRNVAIKRLKAPFQNDPRVKSVFEREALVTSQLEHPGVVPIYGHGTTTDGLAFYAMRYVEGKTLAQHIPLRVQPWASPLMASEDSSSELIRSNCIKFMPCLVSACETVAYAHRQGIIHRDLKPDNLLIGNDMDTYVLDWGMALSLREDCIGWGSLDSALLVGSLAYMSPEQAHGKVSEIDERTDVFGLGGVLYSILTHRLPYFRDTYHETLEQARCGAMEPPQSVAPSAPSFLCRTCMKAMSINKNDRHQTVMELIADLKSWQPSHGESD